MARLFTRQQLYEIVWSEPVRNVAAEYGISDVAFSKFCRKHGIPLPPRGHWARIEGGKTVERPPLPRRGLGMPEELRSGRNWTEQHAVPSDLADATLGPPPSFPENEADLTKRIKGLVGAVSIPNSLANPHPQIARLLSEDEERRRRAAAFDGPYFDSPFERRRLRFLSGIFLALARLDVSVLARAKNPADFDITIGEQHASITADHAHAQRYSWASQRDAQLPDSTKLTVALRSYRDGDIIKKWEDRPNDPVEGSATDIVVSILVFGELRYRRREKSHYEWLVERQRLAI